GSEINLRKKFLIVLLMAPMLQGCGSSLSQIKNNLILFYDPLYHMDAPQGPCREKGNIIECDWKDKKIVHYK
ncbi:TPA: hypothetical protein ACIPBK_004929, partial [Salmonella enterica subsp. enterica serovar Birkenhead]